MGYTDGLYFGKCLIRCIPMSASDEGKTVSVTDGTNTWTKEIEDYETPIDFEVPNRNLYAITLNDGGTVEFAKAVCLGYGEFAKVILAEGYEPIYQTDILNSASGIMANIDSSKVAGALGVKEFNVVNTFNIATSDWSSNTDPETSTDYPYVCTKASALYSASSTPVWDIQGADDVITIEEKTSADMVAVAIFDTTGITLYATDQPVDALVLRVKGV